MKGLSFIVPKAIRQWDVFGGKIVFVHLSIEVPLWRRVITRIFLGSVWRRLP